MNREGLDTFYKVYSNTGGTPPMSKAIPKQHTKKCESFPFEICIPVSADENPVQLRDTTLLMCKAYRIPAEKITVLVAEKSQEAGFRSTLLPGTYGRILTGKRIQSGFFSEGTPIVYINSCITGIYEYDSEAEGQRKATKSLLGLLKAGFSEAEKAGALLWGIQTLDSPRRALKPKVGKSLRLISRFFFGCIFSDFDAHLRPEDDVERTLLFYQKTGSVVTLKMYGITTCKKSGWSPSEARRLQGLYSEFVTVTEKGGCILLVLRDSYKHKKKKE